MTTTINASTSSGLVSTADTSGIIKVQSNGVTTNALAWVNFDGTLASPTPSASYNVTSITKNSTGDYTINFTNAMSDVNYAAFFAARGSNPVATANESDTTNRTTSLIRMLVGTSTTGVVADRTRVSVAIFGN